MSVGVSETGSFPGESGDGALDQLCIDTIRTLSMDAVEKANSGHPGLPMAMAPVAHLLYTRVLKHNPADPNWPDRDRFVLSAGHGSMLLYSILHLTGYDLPMSELERFRQWDSRTPGHPERIFKAHAEGYVDTPGVETTTGPLGQGFANGIGLAMAERFLRERYGSEVMDHRVFSICSDGDLMEGVSAEAASLAGHLGLGRIVYLYDDNHITIDGSTSLSFASEDVEARFRAYGWHTLSVGDVNDLDELQAAVDAGIAEEERPTLIRVRSIIGYPAPNKQGTSKAHGSALGADEVRATKEIMGWDPDAQFLVPDSVREAYAHTVERGARLQEEWETRFASWRGQQPDLAAEWDCAWAGKPAPGLEDALPKFDPEETEKLATRAAGGKVQVAMAPYLPTMVGGSADLAGSTLAIMPGEDQFGPGTTGRTVHWGIREHAMGSAVNGLALHGGIVRPYGGTFLVFSDYMRPAIRLSALMGLPVVWVFTHDSVGLGEDGPTHQPVEHYAALRAIPGLTVIRPGDANETAQAWHTALEPGRGPVCLLLTRQNLPVLSPDVVGDGPTKGAYVLAEAPGNAPDAIIVATGSEVAVAMAAQLKLSEQGVAARVVSMPSWELFEEQDQDYQDDVLRPGVPTVSVEAGISMGWSRWADASVAIDRFGASAPGDEVMRRLGINPDHVAATVLETLGHDVPQDA
ncbi:MAG TPA: transketolase [Solirubrobacteraceae bacterium]|nr:transketolase [Solirubrobacteraceae bacterium]